MSDAGRHAPPMLLELALVATVMLLGQLEVWVPDLTQPNLVGPRPVIAAFYLATASLLLWRTSHPLQVLAAIAAVDIVHFVSIGAPEGMGTLLPLLVITYSIAAHLERRDALRGGALAVGVVVVHELLNPDNTDLQHIVDAVAWDFSVVGAWLAGAYVRTRRLYAHELHERAARAEWEREERAHAAAAEERARISRELHDILAHALSVIVVQAEGAQEVVARDPERAGQALGRIHTTGRSALTELRGLLHAQRERDDNAGLGPQPGLADLETLLREMRETGLEVTRTDAGTARELPAGLQLAAYRIVQEALTNVRKHAAATRVQVSLDWGRDSLAIEVCDDGASPSPEGPDGFGLIGMRERVEHYGGEVMAGPGPSGGFRVAARLPFPAGAR